MTFLSRIALVLFDGYGWNQNRIIMWRSSWTPPANYRGRRNGRSARGTLNDKGYNFMFLITFLEL